MSTVTTAFQKKDILNTEWREFTINISSYTTQSITRIWLYVVRTKFQHQKAFINCSFKDQAACEAYLEQWMIQVEKRITEREQLKLRVREIRSNMVNPYQVGDIFYTSWGYEQTNVNFFQVVEVGKKSVMIREINSEANESGYMSGTKTAVKDSFCGEAFKKNLQVSRYNGEIYISGDHSFQKWDGRPKMFSSYH